MWLAAYAEVANLGIDEPNEQQKCRQLDWLRYETDITSVQADEHRWLSQLDVVACPARGRRSPWQLTASIGGIDVQLGPSLWHAGHVHATSWSC